MKLVDSLESLKNDWGGAPVISYVERLRTHLQRFVDAHDTKASKLEVRELVADARNLVSEGTNDGAAD